MVKFFNKTDFQIKCLIFHLRLKMNKKKKFDILETFEIFNKESISVLKKVFIDIIMLETDNIFTNKNTLCIDIKKDDSAQITVLNDKKTFDLLSNTWKRHKKKLTLENGIINEKNNQRNISNQLNLS